MSWTIKASPISVDPKALDGIFRRGDRVRIKPPKHEEYIHGGEWEDLTGYFESQDPTGVITDIVDEDESIEVSQDPDSDSGVSWMVDPSEIERI